MGLESLENEARLKKLKAAKDSKEAKADTSSSDKDKDKKEDGKQEDDSDWRSRGTQWLDRADAEHVPRSVCESLASFQTSWPVLSFPYKNFDKVSFSQWCTPNAPLSTVTTTVIARTSFVGFGVGDFAAELPPPPGAPGVAHIVYSQTYDAEEKMRGTRFPSLAVYSFVCHCSEREGGDEQISRGCRGRW